MHSRNNCVERVYLACIESGNARFSPSPHSHVSLTREGTFHTAECLHVSSSAAKNLLELLDSDLNDVEKSMRKRD